MRALNIVLLVTGIVISVMATSNRTVAVTDAKGEPHNVALIYGLHVTLPDDMRTFPAELVPLP